MGSFQKRSVDQNDLIGQASLIARVQVRVQIEEGKPFFLIGVFAIISKGLKFSLQNFRMLSLTFVSFLIYLKLLSYHLSRQLSLLMDHHRDRLSLTLFKM